MKAALSLRDLGVTRARTQILSGITLDINAGELIVIMGASGAGKSTLLRAICGLQRSQTGTIHIDGEEVTSAPPHRRSTALMMDEDALFPHMSVAENVSFAVNTELRDTDPTEQVDVALTSLGIAHLATRYPGQLSLGQRQIVSLARVLVRRPRILLVDEPLAHVDTVAREHLKAELVRVHKRMNCATVYVTHDVNEALSIADRIIYLSNGRIVQDDYPEEVYESPATLPIARHFGATTFLMTTAHTYTSPFGERRARTHVLGQSLDVAASALLPSSGTCDIVLVGHPASVSMKAVHSARKPRVTDHYGQVTEVTFMGEYYRVIIESERGALTVRTPTDAPPTTSGDSVEISLDPSKLWALPATATNSTDTRASAQKVV
ncbi:MAG: ABC transporter ATP-binding protein [Actinomycetaceae bacterium]|nr:ABC transporter ATP-binding protein [Actinomycetaceae bacterium]